MSEANLRSMTWRDIARPFLISFSVGLVACLLIPASAALASPQPDVSPGPPQNQDESLKLRHRNPRAYSITDLGSFIPAAINDKGDVVGSQRIPSEMGFVQDAFLWQDGEMTDLGTLVSGPFRQNEAVAINDHGQIAGASYNGTESHAFLWQDGQLTDLGSLSEQYRSFCFGINNRGQVVGSAAAVGGDRAFLWEDGQLINLTSVVGSSRVTGINSKGVLAGYGNSSIIPPHGPPPDHAFIWRDGDSVDLGALDGSFSGGNSIAVAINRKEQVVGGSGHAFLWEEGQMMDLGTLGGPSSFANALNDEGTVVGFSDTADRQQHAFVWQRGQMQDLNNLVRNGSDWVLNRATGINKRGQIVGNGVHNGQFSGFLLTPFHQHEHDEIP